MQLIHPTYKPDLPTPDNRLIAAEANNMIHRLNNGSITLDECAARCDALAVQHPHLAAYWERYARVLRATPQRQVPLKGGV